MVNDTELKRPDDANYKVEMNSLKTAFEVGNNSGQHYTPSYDSVYKSVPSQKTPTSSNKMAEAIIRPPVAGTRETDDYSASFNKEKLGNLKSMFEQKRKETNSAEPKAFVPDYSRSTPGTTKIASSSANQPQDRDPNVIYSVAGEREVADYKPSVSISAAKSMFEQKKPSEYTPKNKFSSKPGKITIPKIDSKDIVKNSDTIDDRPKELTTSLLSARAMFEGGNHATNSQIVKEVASWDGKGENDVLAAKAVFAGGDNAVVEKEAEVEVIKKIEPNDEVEAHIETVEPEVQENKVQEAEIQEPEVQEPEVQEPEVQEPEVQEPKVQEEPVQEPENEQPEKLEESVPAQESTELEPVEIEDSENVETPVPEQHEQQEEQELQVKQEEEVAITESVDQQLPETVPETATENPEVVEQHSELTQPSALPIDDTTAPTTVEPTPEVEEKTVVSNPEDASLNPSPTKQVNQASTNQSKDDDYDSADVLSDEATTTSQEGENNKN